MSGLRRAPRTGAWGSAPRSPTPPGPPPPIPAASGLCAPLAGALAGRGKAVKGDEGKGGGGALLPAPCSRAAETPEALCVRNRIPHLPSPPPIPAFFPPNRSPSRVSSN